MFTTESGYKATPNYYDYYYFHLLLLLLLLTILQMGSRKCIEEIIDIIYNSSSSSSSSQIKVKARRACLEKNADTPISKVISESIHLATAKVCTF
jgi:hypothetical protein